MTPVRIRKDHQPPRPWSVAWIDPDGVPAVVHVATWDAALARARRIVCKRVRRAAA